MFYYCWNGWNAQTRILSIIKKSINNNKIIVKRKINESQFKHNDCVKNTNGRSKKNGLRVENGTHDNFYLFSKALIVGFITMRFLSCHIFSSCLFSSTKKEKSISEIITICCFLLSFDLQKNVFFVRNRFNVICLSYTLNYFVFPYYLKRN